MEPRFVTVVEGGSFIDWKDWNSLELWRTFGTELHAVVFSDGRVFDPVNGWRPGQMDVEAIKVRYTKDNLSEFIDEQIGRRLRMRRLTNG